MNSWADRGAKSQSASNSKSNDYIDPKKIEDSFLALKKMCALTNEEITSEPCFTDKKATIYLHITPKYMRKKGMPNKLVLRHPLSYKRAVCYIANHMDKPAQSKKIEHILNKIGVNGKIKTIPLSLVRLAEREKNIESLDELATLYDTHIVEEDLSMIEVANALNRCRKRVVMVKLRPGPGQMEEAFRDVMATTIVFPTATGKSIDLRVGHVGMTPAQVVENVLGAMAFLLDKGFSEGYSSLHSVRLKSGNSDADAFDLYLDGSTKLEMLQRQEQREQQEQQKDQQAKNLKMAEEQKDKETQIPQIPRGSLQLAAGLSSLKKLMGWTGAGAAAPRFTDEEANLYLKLSPLERIPRQSGEPDTIVLTHPLSFKRRVCLVVTWDAPAMDGPDVPMDVALMETVREIGVQGFVQIIHHKNMPLENSEFAALAAVHDTIIADESLYEYCAPLIDALRLRGMALALTNLKKVEGRRERIEAELRRSAVVAYGSQYLVKVGHTGLTRQQLSENLASALASLFTLQCFPPSPECFRFVRLENGRGLGTPVYLNENEDTIPAEQAEHLYDKFATEQGQTDRQRNTIVTRWGRQRNGLGNTKSVGRKRGGKNLIEQTTRLKMRKKAKNDQ